MNSQWQIELKLQQLKSHCIAKNLPMARLRTLAELLYRLRKVEESGDGWSACCPAHADSRPSLSIGITLDGRILLKCHRDCEFPDIVQDAGMMMSEMFESAPSPRSAILPPRRPSNRNPEATPADSSWAKKQILFRQQANPSRVQQLADQLGVTAASLESIGVGWRNRENCWTFPERNGKREICGIVRRFPNGDKYAFKGGHRGLTLPSNWDQSDHPLHVCEGASDVATAISIGMRAIGRPGLKSGFCDLAVLLKDEQAELVMVADNDAEGAGRTGAEQLAKRLSNTLRKLIQVMAPPTQFKDLREYLTEKTR